MISQKSLILAKVETTYGTDPTPTTTSDAVQVYNVELELKRDTNSRQPMDVSLSPLSPVMGAGDAKISFECDLKGSGTAGTPPDWAVLHKACGWAETDTTNTDTYLPDDTPTDSVTLYVYKDGLLYKLLGARGDVKHTFEAGKIVKLKYDLQARYAIPTDATMPTAATFDTTKPVVAVGSTFTFGSYAAIIEKLELGLNNEVVKNSCLNAAYGVHSFEITGRKPKGKMTVNAVLRATTNADFWSYMDAGTTKALSIVIGATAGNIATITAPVCTITSVKPVSKNGIECFDVDFELNRNSAADELSIVMT